MEYISFGGFFFGSFFVFALLTLEEFGGDLQRG